MKYFFAFFSRQLRALSFYRFEFFVKIVYGLIAMYGAKYLWLALSKQNPDLLGRSLSSMITYAMLAMAIDIVFYPAGENSVDQYMNRQVRTGSIDTDLLRPLDFQLQMLYRNSSYVISMFIILVIPSCAFGVLFMGMQLPQSPLQALLFGLSLILAYFVLFSLNFLLGLLSMITLNIKQVTWAYRGLVSLLSGKLVPLWLFPPFAQSLVYMLPFRCIYDIPLNIYTGAFDGKSMAAQLGLQLFWALALFISGRALWRIVHRRLTVQGG